MLKTIQNKLKSTNSNSSNASNTRAQSNDNNDNSNNNSSNINANNNNDDNNKFEIDVTLIKELQKKRLNQFKNIHGKYEIEKEEVSIRSSSNSDNLVYDDNDDSDDSEASEVSEHVDDDALLNNNRKILFMAICYDNNEQEKNEDLDAYDNSEDLDDYSEDLDNNSEDTSSVIDLEFIENSDCDNITNIDNNNDTYLL
eukprot:Pgem_evm3s3736